MIFNENYWDDANAVIKQVPNIDKLKGKKVLITGSTGMICSTVADLIFHLNQKEFGIKLFLAGRNRDRVNKRFEEFQDGKDYSFVEYDATKDMNLDLVTDYIIHGASNANPTVYTKQPVETMLSNLVGLNSLLQLAVRKAAKRLLYISSSEVYGNVSGNKPYIEDNLGSMDILNVRACYPCAKRAAETLCISYSEEYQMETVIVRPGHIYGPTIARTDSRASAQFTWDAVDGRDIVMKSSGDQMRSYCYTMDCASAILAVLLNGENREAYNISNRDSVVSIRDMAEALADYVGTKIVFENSSDIERKSYNPMLNSSLNAEKLENIGWRACFDLNSGVRRTIDYLRKN